MKDELYNIRSQSKAAKESINSTKQNIKNLKNRLEDIEKLINEFNRVDNYSGDINGYISNIINHLQYGLVVDNKKDIETSLNFFKENNRYNDAKISTVLHQLEQEKNLIKGQIASENNTMNSLKDNLSELRNREKSILSETI